MKSKISCFNKTIFKKNFTQFWPLWAAYAFVMILVMPVTLYQQMQRRYYHIAEVEDIFGKQISSLVNVFEASTEPLLLFLFSTLAVMAVFSYLYTSKNANGMHALPVTRLELFVTNFLSAFGNLAIVNVVVFVIAVFVGIACGVTKIDVLFYILLIQLGINFFATAFATFVAMLTGHLLTMPVFTLIANFLYVGICYILTYLVSEISYGVSASFKERDSYVLSPLYYLTNAVDAGTQRNKVTGMTDGITLEGGMTVAGYAVAALFVLVIAYQLYKKRQVETAGDIISVGFMKPVLRIGVGICFGFTGGLILVDFLFDYGSYTNALFVAILVCSIFCGAIGYFGAEMLMQKSFRVFKKPIVIEAVVTFAVMIIATSALKLDVFGIEKKIPAKEEIVCAFTDFNYPVRFDGDDIDFVLEFHQQILETKEENLAAIENDESRRSVQFIYYLEDGSSFRRNYWLPINDEDPFDETMLSAKLATIEASGEEMAKHLFGTNYETNGFIAGYLSRYDEESDRFYDYSFTDEELHVIAEAVMKDVLAGNYSRYVLYNYSTLDDEQFVNNLELTYYNEKGIESNDEVYWNGFSPEIVTEETMVEIATSTAASSDYIASKYETNNVYLSFGKNCVHTVKALEDLGIVGEEWPLYTEAEYSKLVDEKY